MQILVLLILILQQTICSIDLECIPQNILITLGDFFSNEESSVIYRVSFMQKKQNCQNKLILKVFVEDHVQEFYQKDRRKYDFTGQSYGQDVDYHREFGMFELENLKNELKFSYGIFMENRMLAGPFFFDSNVANYNSGSFKFVSFGDQDLEVGQANLDRLKHEKFDMIILLGDYSYDMEENNGLKGDYYLSQMEQLFSRVPTILVPGNHEFLDNTKFFTTRFWFPGTNNIEENNLFAFAINNSFFLAYNTDYYMMNPNQQLDIINKIESYLKHGQNFNFKFFINHRPFYCSQLYWPTKECQLSILYQKDLNDLLLKYGVDVVLSGHIHDYQRLASMKNYTLDQNSYKQFIIGSGGSQHSFGPLPKQPREFLEKEVQDTVGYALIEITSDKFLLQFKECYTNQVLDEYEIDKTHKVNLERFIILFTIIFAVVFVAVFMLWKHYDSTREYDRV